ncbi:MAG: polysaccharide biosynthesis C-terminal domain-containing protein [Methylococcaceae bacterium]|nr:polysaccharide biosynthesis C-terminal domain-containing protein [Methylococcaceae bacterium]
MNPLKQLASQTAVYGLSSILGRFINYLLVPLYTYLFTPAEYGVVSEFYAYAGFFAVVLVCGLETGYFRFRAAAEDKTYSTALYCVLLIDSVFLSVLYAGSDWLAPALQYQSHPEYLVWFGSILALDAAAAIPFARLRAENRALRFAAIKIAEILVAVALNLYLIVYCRHAFETSPDSFSARWYDPNVGIGYIFIANLIASVFKVILLLPQLSGLKAGVDFGMLARLLRYSLPMVVIGLAGAVNETLDRAIMKALLPYDLQTNLHMLGVYGACYKLSILMSLFIQAFRYAGEPFFFAQAGKKESARLYADVMRYFVIFCVFVFLLVTLYLDVFKYFIGEPFRVGLGVVPILLLANLFLGIYVNLSVWYKLTDRTGLGALVALIGAGIAVALNVWWIPIFGYLGSAWAHLICYFVMCALSYSLSRRYYPVRYDLKAVSGFILFGLAIYFANSRAVQLCGWHPLVTGSLSMAVFLSVTLMLEMLRRRFRARSE